MTKVSKFDATDDLKTPVAIAAYLTEAFETNDPAYICSALDTVRGLKAWGTSQRSRVSHGKVSIRPSKKRRSLNSIR